MSGVFGLFFMGATCNFIGGPYRDKPITVRGVNMAAEIDMPAAIRIPTKDFSVPNKRALRKGLLDAYKLFLDESVDVLYVGCMGGVGRTGLFMAAFAKMTGEAHPIEFVRFMYNPHAVETKEQELYIASLRVWDLRWKARLLSWTRNVRGYFT